jgi:hypothetical protein
MRYVLKLLNKILSCLTSNIQVNELVFEVVYIHCFYYVSLNVKNVSTLVGIHTCNCFGASPNSDPAYIL